MRCCPSTTGSGFQLDPPPSPKAESGRVGRANRGSPECRRRGRSSVRGCLRFARLEPPSAPAHSPRKSVPYRSAARCVPPTATPAVPLLQHCAVLLWPSRQQCGGAQLSGSKRVVQTFPGNRIDQACTVADHGPTVPADFEPFESLRTIRRENVRVEARALPTIAVFIQP